jgi:hypothetical protein
MAFGDFRKKLRDMAIESGNKEGRDLDAPAEIRQGNNPPPRNASISKAPPVKSSTMSMPDTVKKAIVSNRLGQVTNEEGRDLDAPKQNNRVGINPPPGNIVASKIPPRQDNKMGMPSRPTVSKSSPRFRDLGSDADSLYPDADRRKKLKMESLKKIRGY